MDKTDFARERCKNDVTKRIYTPAFLCVHTLCYDTLHYTIILEQSYYAVIGWREHMTQISKMLGEGKLSMPA